MNDKLLEPELKKIKININKFVEHVEDYLNSNSVKCNQSDSEFIRFISKQIIFLKMICFDKELDVYRISLISDFYFLMNSILENQIRYIFLNKRSIIENYIRLIKKIENGRVTINAFEGLSDNKYENYLDKNYYSFLKSQYSEACEYIHGGEKWQESLVEDYLSCLKNNSNIGEGFKNKNSFYKNFYKSISILNRMMLIEHSYNMISYFHRKGDIIKYLQEEKYHSLYVNLKE
ncbi:hypothetical protein [Peptostreptococcus sp. D1]|uniref:hypothetical protein n=1 Tax=Peptostreptococcus sp. D1 TaxID=72304 RepID=UPI0008E01B95|nr:hypothetical protein [Peptostreptococcus sp. D1]SFE88152.1 hypothetical protein SAMN02910278_01954 [Peptostreptococcus sp. D1]